MFVFCSSCVMNKVSYLTEVLLLSKLKAHDHDLLLETQSQLLHTEH